MPTEADLAEIDSDRRNYLDETFDYYDQTYGLTGPGQGDDFLDDTRERTQRRAIKQLGGYYSSIDSTQVDVHVAVDLLVSREEGYQLDDRMGTLLDSILAIERDRLTQELNHSRPQNLDTHYKQSELTSLNDYFGKPPAERRDPRFFTDKIIDGYVTKAVRQCVTEYLLPLKMWMPEIPFGYYDEENPGLVLEILHVAIDSQRYPSDKPSEIHEDSVFGEKFLESPLEIIVPYGGTVSDDGLVLQYPINNLVPREIMEEAMSQYGHYFAEVANGTERAPRDCYHLLNFGILALQCGQLADIGMAAKYFEAAQSAFLLARDMAKAWLSEEDNEAFIQLLPPFEGEATLRIALHQLFDHDKAEVTEEHLLHALQSFDTHLQHESSDQRVTFLRTWTLYHLGVFYQDVVHNPANAINYFTKAFELLPAVYEIPPELKERMQQRLDQVNDVVTIQTKDGEKKVSFLEHLNGVLAIDASMQKAVIDHYQQLGLHGITVPEIVGITGACENVDTLFKIGNRSGTTLFFTQTGQLSLEQAQQVFKDGVYTIIHSGRDEEVEDKRHLRQFSLIEEEFSCGMADMTRESFDEEKMFEALLNHIELATKQMVRAAVDEDGKILTEVFSRNVDELREAIENQYLRITYEDALKLLNDNGFTMHWGDDLKADHEQTVVRLVNAINRNRVGPKVPHSDIPVFIMRYPKEIKFFNMKVSEKDPRVVLSADLILPISGESTGAAVREHNGEKLRSRLLESTMYRLHVQRGGTLNDFEWYLQIIDEERTDPHAGYGIGADRVMQYILGQPDIRICSVMGMLARQTRDWEQREPEAIVVP